MEAELLLIDKPKGITSFDVIRRLRRQYSTNHAGAKAPKLGHAGTLDPLASGLMLLGVGKGTKKLTELLKLRKEYIADIRIGERRSTGDLEGEILVEKAVTETIVALEPKILAAVQSLVGTQTLPVSAYSAIKVDGVPMYKRARKAEKDGDVVAEVPVREMQVLETELISFVIDGTRAIARVRFFVGSGTYIRSLAEELGNLVGYPATLQDLQRTKIGEYTLAQAKKIGECFV